MKKYIFLIILSFFLSEKFSIATYDNLHIDRFASTRKDVVLEGRNGQYDIKRSSHTNNEIQGLYLKAFHGNKKDFHLKKGDTFKYNFKIPTFMCESVEIKIKNSSTILFTRVYKTSPLTEYLTGEGEYTFDKDEIQIQVWLKFIHPHLPAQFEFSGYIAGAL